MKRFSNTKVCVYLTKQKDKRHREVPISFIDCFAFEEHEDLLEITYQIEKEFGENFHMMICAPEPIMVYHRYGWKLDRLYGYSDYKKYKKREMIIDSVL